MSLFDRLWKRNDKVVTAEQIKQVGIDKLKAACKKLFPRVVGNDDGTWTVDHGDCHKIATVIVENAVERSTADEIIQEYRDMLNRAKITAAVKTAKTQSIIKRMNMK
jgi:hypothetical protein